MSQTTKNNYNTHIAQYIKKQRTSGNGIWYINGITCEIFLFFKNHAEMRQGD